MYKMQSPLEYCTNLLILIQPLLFFKNLVLLKCQINLLHTQCVGTRFCIRYRLLRELTASQLVTCSDNGSHNRLDLTHTIYMYAMGIYQCNNYFELKTILISFKTILSHNPSWIYVFLFKSLKYFSFSFLSTLPSFIPKAINYDFQIKAIKTQISNLSVLCA